MILTNLSVLEKVVADFKGDKRDLPGEIIATFASLQAWAGRSFSAHPRKAKVGDVAKEDPESLPLPLRAQRTG